MVPASQVEVRSAGGIGGAGEDEGIVGAAVFAFPGAEDGGMLAVLPDALDRERAAGDISAAKAESLLRQLMQR